MLRVESYRMKNKMIICKNVVLTISIPILSLLSGANKKKYRYMIYNSQIMALNLEIYCVHLNSIQKSR